MEKTLKLKPVMKKIKQGGTNLKHVAILQSILKHTSEVCIHQQNGASRNKVFVQKDGHLEAVFDANGVLVQDGINDGSYNYCHPAEGPLRHFSFDISPWIVWGQTRTDPTTVKSRIYAYMGDLEGGIRRALASMRIPGHIGHPIRNYIGHLNRRESATQYGMISATFVAGSEWVADIVPD
ncbi:MAG: hypothetical protein HQ523_00990, partial [Lentisphaerae bacterium]|nr:hypothetical protein [Lentisphaerota bacterium]